MLSTTEAAECYGYGLVQQLRAAGLTDVADASVYGTLKRLETAELLATRLQPSEGGPPRKYYRLTPAGRREVSALRRQWRAICAAMHELGASGD